MLYVHMKGVACNNIPIANYRQPLFFLLSFMEHLLTHCFCFFQSRMVVFFIFISIIFSHSMLLFSAQML